MNEELERELEIVLASAHSLIVDLNIASERARKLAIRLTDLLEDVKYSVGRE